MKRRLPTLQPSVVPALSSFSLYHLQIFLDGYGTNLVTSDLIFSHHFTQSVLCEGPRRSTRFGFPVVVLPHSTFKPSPAKPYRIRTSENPRLQLPWNPHLQKRLLSVDSKRLSLAEWGPRPFYNQHLRGYPVSAENAGPITPLESTLTENPPATPLESALPRNSGRGEGYPSITRLFLPRTPGILRTGL